MRLRFDLGDRLGRALGDDLAAAEARLGAEVDQPVGRLDDLQVVLDDDDRVAQVGQAVDDVEELADVVEVQAGRRLVEDVEGLARVGPGQLGGELHALGLAAGERRRGLAERDVAEADVVQGLQDLADLGDARRTAPGRRRRVMSSTSAIVLPRNFTARVSGVNRRPPQASQVTQTSGRKCISIRFWPAPSHASHRPPGWLKLNRRGE